MEYNVRVKERKREGRRWRSIGWVEVIQRGREDTHPIHLRVMSISPRGVESGTLIAVVHCQAHQHNFNLNQLHLSIPSQSSTLPYTRSQCSHQYYAAFYPRKPVHQLGHVPPLLAALTLPELFFDPQHPRLARPPLSLPQPHHQRPSCLSLVIFHNGCPVYLSPPQSLGHWSAKCEV
jgi:hypothetical protein